MLIFKDSNPNGLLGLHLDGLFREERIVVLGTFRIDAFNLDTNLHVARRSHAREIDAGMKATVNAGCAIIYLGAGSNRSTAAKNFPGHDVRWKASLIAIPAQISRNLTGQYEEPTDGADLKHVGLFAKAIAADTIGAERVERRVFRIHVAIGELSKNGGHKDHDTHHSPKNSQFETVS
jgi:hypothetical protein